jgi:phosphopantothenoylcysteine decarboxylase/phosphopantothenate--cysteine ligase
LIKVINVVSAEMYDTCQLYYDVDVAIAAAVADYKPKNVANHKIKKK